MLRKHKNIPEESRAEGQRYKHTDRRKEQPCDSQPETILTEEAISSYALHLRNMERSDATLDKYMKNIRNFAAWTGGKPVTREMVIAWKVYLVSSGLSPATVNTKLAALNGLFAFLGWYDCRIQYLKVQKQLFRPSEKDLTEKEYDRLVQAAKDAGDIRLMLLMETICSTGIRVSEVKEPLNNQPSCHHARQAPNDKLENHLDFALNFF